MGVVQVWTDSYTFMGTEILNPCQLILLNKYKLQYQLIISSQVGSKTVLSLSYNQGRALHFNYATHIISCFFFPENLNEKLQMWQQILYSAKTFWASFIAQAQLAANL